MAISVWHYRKGRYGQLAGVLVVLALFGYLLEDPVGGRNGGTWAGYVIGTAAAALTLWLGWFGVRKRRYGKHMRPLEEVLSAHVNLGVAAFLLATLHTGFEFGWNFHLLAYVLLLTITLSGFAGVALYNYVPVAMTANANGQSTSDMIEEIAELNREARRAGAELDDEINRLVRRAVQYTEIGGGVWKLLTGHYRERHGEEALSGVREMAEQFTVEQAEAGRRLVSLLARRAEVVGRLRRHLRYEAWMDVWLYLHLPVSFAYFAALAGHIVFVFYF